MISPKPVYPRWRGEHTVISLPLGDRNGLSPLARGTRNSLRIRQQKYRFIPAGAGNTALLCRSRSVPTVYPRWRGEHGNRSLNSTPASGLSPLARGTHLSPYEFYAPSRFIPAGAGNTASHSIRWFSMTVYPRWRGEHVTWRRPAIDFSGLSPLARGTLEPVFRSARNVRFIPAGAGNTVRIGFENLYAPVYPRWRGEHKSGSVAYKIYPGLSPLARGTHTDGDVSAEGDRFIPAGAGNTGTGPQTCQRRAVYPRWRGEHLNDLISSTAVPGLSPLARGTLRDPLANVHIDRFIPAGAGNTLNITYY